MNKILIDLPSISKLVNRLCLLRVGWVIMNAELMLKEMFVNPRIEKCIEQIKANDLDAVVLNPRKSLTYLSDLHFHLNVLNAPFGAFFNAGDWLFALCGRGKESSSRLCKELCFHFRSKRLNMKCSIL
jgi:hypothetical protein